MTREPTQVHDGRHGRESSRWRTGEDDGHILILALGFTVVFLLLVSVVVSLTGLQLERTRLLHLADNLALAAADSLAEDAIYRPDAERRQDRPIELRDEDVRAAAVEFLDQHPEASEGFTDLVLVAADSPDGRAARIVLAIREGPTLLSPVTGVIGDGVVLEAESTARVW